MRTIYTFLLLFISSFLYCQTYTPPVVKVSTEKVKHNGIIKYVHKVKKQETLYSIAKAYNVSIEEIVRNNESVKDGLKEGATLLIPSYDEIISQEKKLSGRENKKNSVQDNEENKDMGVSTADDYEQQSVIDKIPVNVIPAEYYMKTLNVKLEKHKKKWYQSIEDIAQKYKVPVDALMHFNGLKTKELAKRQVLYIPNYDYISAYNSHVINHTDSSNTEIIVEEDSTELLVNDIESIFEYSDLHTGNAKENIELSYILPLNINNRNNINANLMDFYSGALLAVNKIKEKGYNIKVNTYDLDELQLEDFSQLSNSDLIIGPIKSKDINSILLKIGGTEVPVVSPMDPNADKLVKSFRNLIQAPTSDSIQISNLIDIIRKRYINPSNNIILITEEDNSSDSELVMITKQILDTNNIPYKEISYEILKGREILKSITAECTLSGDNLFIVPSKSEAFVNDVVRNLNLLNLKRSKKNMYNIKLFGLAKWRYFETIEPDYFHNLSLHLSLPFYVNYDSFAVKDFLLSYRALFSSEPTPYSYQGYDLTKYFLEIIGNYGKEFVMAKQLPTGKMLQTKFGFEKLSPSSGMYNTSTIDVIYNKDFSISIID